MAAADVGDDVFGEDPTVNRLQSHLAELTGKEDALFFPSGTQSNLAALMSHCQRGDEYLVGQQAHTYRYEGGGAAVLGSIQPQPLEHAADGSIPIDALRAAIKPVDPHYARTRLVALENTIGGKVLSMDYVKQAADLASEIGLAFHLDGARVCNAAVALQTPLAYVCQPFDSVSICFSKGLGAPVGSALVGSRDLIAQARRWRKMLGGGMRQAGMLAAACLYALEHNYERLAEDHENAAWLANELRQIEQLQVLSQHTNMVFVTVPATHVKPLEAHLAQRGVVFRGAYGGATRLVTHLDITREDLATAAKAIRSYFGA